MGKLLSVAEAADSLGVHRTRVNQLIDGGALPAIRIGKAYAIQESDLELVRERPPRGRPPKSTAYSGATAAAYIALSALSAGTLAKHQQEPLLAPECTVNRSEADVRAEIEHRREITEGGKFPNLCRKFVKADPKEAIPNRWRIAFTIEVSVKELDKAIENLVTNYGVKVVAKMGSGFSRGAWIECDEYIAERISEIRTVRRVTQDARHISRPAILPSRERP